MSSSSIVIESKDIREHNHARDHKIVVSPTLPIKDRKFEAIRIRIHRHFAETIKSSVVVFACLALYKIAGFHAWWSQFVHRMLFLP